MKIFIACLGTETNTFSPIPTGLENFSETTLFHGDATQHAPDLFTAAMHVWRKNGEMEQATIVESVAAFAQPAGITVRKVYEDLRDELLADLKAALPVDMVLLSMHGAMVADGYDDCEGDLLRRCREVVGPDTVIGGELDLHCSITPDMCGAADALVTFKEYPHIDPADRAEELYAICRDKRMGQTNPVMAVHDCRMVSTWRTPDEPMKTFVARMQELEGQDGILSVSLAHGFPWGDVPHATARMLVIADGDQAKADDLARQLGREIWDLRHETAPVMTPYKEALAQAAAAAAGPVVIADTADNAGGGAPSDSTFLLREILDQGLNDVLTGLYWDPMAIRHCREAGEGARLDLRIGGKCCRESGLPVDLNVTVERIIEKAYQPFGDVRNSMGMAVWLKADGNVNLVLNSVRTQTFHPDAFRQFGIDLSAMKIIVAKSSQHFYAGFAPLASQVIYASSPGTLNMDFANLPYEKLTTPYWPRIEDPFS
ncbi:MAG: M81 family metallopeptidase [Rhodospirillaceae bacterium]|nr:M81 family metallopeptidase [Rhodospirillaceae bacterium]MBT5193414.1 M81 family metallopeptidase [Rhodospirillaceae bacterium]MBT5894628.1 M81 family metallopeptidase [Rhodospirillaceae bacterium]MBT6429272.1 M81 family metallopeptidase [Rhodospirillaceae bacterium]MBT7758908.1 M81 family metallopeptidase [Rhodospirillaceae bacterium]